jgi:hypothetical protein
MIYIHLYEFDKKGLNFEIYFPIYTSHPST